MLVCAFCDKRLSPAVVLNFCVAAVGVRRDGKYAEAARALAAELQNFPRSRAALSLLGYCYYYMQVCFGILGLRLAGLQCIWGGCCVLTGHIFLNFTSKLCSAG